MITPNYYYQLPQHLCTCVYTYHRASEKYHRASEKYHRASEKRECTSEMKTPLNSCFVVIYKKKPGEQSAIHKKFALPATGKQSLGMRLIMDRPVTMISFRQ